MIAASGLGARAGTFELRDITFTVPRGGYGVVIGAAGSGKTTLLETIAGIVAQTAGTLQLGEQRVDGVPPERRGIGIVYQRGYLFPHLSVEQNILYGARDAKFARGIADRLGVESLFRRNVNGLSGGERGIVSLARALAARPPLLLLDEPYSALDPRRRIIVRREVRALHRELGLTVLQVTHDFTEAGLLGDVAILLDGGRMLQAGAPQKVFREPASPYIAEFLGAENIFAGTVCVIGETAPDWIAGEPDVVSRGHRAIEFRTEGFTLYTVGDAPAGPGHAVIRAEDIMLSETPGGGTSARNQLEGKITDIATLGALTRVAIEIRKGTPLIASLTTRSAQELSLREGQHVWATFKAMAVHLC